MYLNNIEQSFLMIIHNKIITKDVKNIACIANLDISIQIFNDII